MKKINKSSEPLGLINWKRQNPSSVYKDLSHVERQIIREACSQEQHFLCAYCCQPISGESKDTVNEHVEAQSLAPNKSLDYNNIVASCKTKGQCDDSHQSQPLPLTPLMDACESELRFKINGRVEGLTERARKAIKVLNLGDHERSNKSLVYKRKHAFVSLLLINQITLGNDDSDLVDDDLLMILKSDLEVTEDGQLLPYAPVLVKMLDQWLGSTRRAH